MDEDLINYGKLIDDAMHIIVKKALEEVVVKDGLPGEHHFFISFLTRYPGVVLSEKLYQKYPKEMTIVLQYQFEELLVSDHYFSVVLSFDNMKERITIPFAALTAFADPSVKFGLQFRYVEEDMEVENASVLVKDAEIKPDAVKADGLDKNVKPADSAIGNVITLDNFRKK